MDSRTTVEAMLRADLRGRTAYGAPQLDVPVALNTNENSYPVPAVVVEAMTKAVAAAASGLNRYPDREFTALREALAAYLSRSGTVIGADQVWAGNGSNEVLLHLLQAFGGPGRTALGFTPAYSMHPIITTTTGTTWVDGLRGVAGGGAFDLDAASAVEQVRAHRPDVVFLCSPNPCLLVVDEAYGQFADWSAIGLVDDETPLVVTRTFSKTWSMAGSRLGYLIGPAWLVAELDKVVLPYHLDAAKQIAGRLALTFVDEMEARVQFIVAERERLSAELAAMDLDVFPSGANFILFRPRSMAGRAVWQRLLDRNVLIRDCSGWPRLGDCLRVTVGTASENDQFLAALTGALSPEAVH